MTVGIAHPRDRLSENGQYFGDTVQAIKNRHAFDGFKCVECFEHQRQHGDDLVGRRDLSADRRTQLQLVQCLSISWRLG